MWGIFYIRTLFGTCENPTQNNTVEIQHTDFLNCKVQWRCFHQAQLDSGLPGWFSDRLVSFSDPKVVPPDGRMGAAAPPDALPHS